MSLKHLALTTAAAVVLGACAQSAETISIANNTNREILVRATPQSMSVPTPAPGASMSLIDKERLLDFAYGFQRDGDGAILIATPADAPASAAYEIRGELIRAGVSPSDIQQGAYDGPSDGSIEIGYSVYEAYVKGCPSYAAYDLADTSTNNSGAPFGCALASNIAAVIADPTHLLQSPDMPPPDAGRRSIVLNKYRQGESTSSERTADESGAISDAVD